MGTEFVIVPETWTVAEATEEVRRNAETVEAVFAVFVSDAQGRVQGMVSLKKFVADTCGYACIRHYGRGCHHGTA